MNTLTFTADEIANLKGKALTDAAATLEIPGRSKMKAAELREAITAQMNSDQDMRYTVTARNEQGTPVEVSWESNDDAVIYEEYAPSAVERERIAKLDFFANHPELSIVPVAVEAEAFPPTFEQHMKRSVENENASDERESPMEQSFADVPTESNGIVSVEAEKWTVVPNREERRAAARRQRKAAGRIAAKNQNN